MKSISEQYQEIQESLELNQQEYKHNQGVLIKKLQELQDKCKHHDSKFDNDQGIVICPDCCKIIQ